MPTFSRSALNPNGSLQADPMDQIELANRQFGAQQNQSDLMAQLALKRLANEDSHFNAELSDRQSARGQHRQDTANQFAAYADLTKAGWGHDDARHASDLESALAIARLQKEPGQLDLRRYEDDKAQRDQVMAYLGMTPGGAPAAGGAPAGAPGLDHGRLQTIAAFNALTHGGSMPDFQGQDERHELNRMEIDDRKRSGAMARAKQALEVGDIAAAKQISAEAGIPLPIPQIEDYMGEHGGLTAELGNLTDSFATRDTNTTGWDPTEDDIKGILDERQRIVQSLVRHGYSEEQATAEANRAITQKLGSRGNEMNAGWIQELRKRLGLSSTAAPASVDANAYPSMNEGG